MNKFRQKIKNKLTEPVEHKICDIDSKFAVYNEYLQKNYKVIFKDNKWQFDKNVT